MLRTLCATIGLLGCVSGWGAQAPPTRATGPGSVGVHAAPGGFVAVTPVPGSLRSHAC